ncbi:FIG00956218: hypothetical protein [hydrothermal vent metagenome]|uniref:Alpha/beta hydrolase n=1 Tax=hydrothermal vent metagenome TaxID=652676 RepID=A0A3B0Z479_9ZZZZ
MKYLLSLFLLFTLVTSNLSMASDKPKIRSLEVQLGTDGRLAWGFHQLMEDKYGFGLRYPGYIIGIEKAVRRKIGVVRASKIDAKIKIRSISTLEKLHLVNWLNDPKRTFISHIVKYDIRNKNSQYRLAHIKPTRIYSVYHELAQNNFKVENSYDRSWKEVKALYPQLKIQIEKEKYTHIFLLSMGWNTDQQEAIRNFNSLMGRLLDIAYKNKNIKFKPLIIGFTWPSKWYLPVVSIINKANDADEIGVVWMNLLLHRVVLPLKKETGIKVVLIGHSLGARALTRAIFSEKFLPGATNNNLPKSDLVIGLQGAFSLYRFVKGKGVEGFPYVNYPAYASKFVMTWSRHDFATPVLKYLANTNLIGGVWGYRIVQRRRYFDIFNTLKVMGTGEIKLPKANKHKILYLDASDIIKYKRYKKYGNAHSDIYTPQFNRLLWSLIYHYTILKSVPANMSAL